MSRSYLNRRNNHDVDALLNSRLIKLITGPRRVGKSTQALLMLRNKNFAYLCLAEWNPHREAGPSVL